MVSFSSERTFEGAARGLVIVDGPKLLVKVSWDAFGFDGSFSRSCFDLASKALMILLKLVTAIGTHSPTATYASLLAGQVSANSQKVPLMPSRTLGFASLRPFLIHFSAMSKPPA